MTPQRFISEVSFYAGATFLYPSFSSAVGFGEERKTLLGYLVGVSGIHKMKKFEIEGRIYYNRTKYEISKTYPFSQSDITNDYVGIGIVPKYILDKKQHFRIGIGSYFSVLQDSEQTHRLLLPGNGLIRTTSSISYYNSIDYGMLYSLSYQFNSTTNKSFKIEALYASGFAIVNGNFSSNGLTGYPLRNNNSLNFLIYYNIKFKTQKL